jgi:hypothetical protein
VYFKPYFGEIKSNNFDISSTGNRTRPTINKQFDPCAADNSNPHVYLRRNSRLYPMEKRETPQELLNHSPPLWLLIETTQRATRSWFFQVLILVYTESTIMLRQEVLIKRWEIAGYSTTTVQSVRWRVYTLSTMYSYWQTARSWISRQLAKGLSRRSW